MKAAFYNDLMYALTSILIQQKKSSLLLEELILYQRADRYGMTPQIQDRLDTLNGLEFDFESQMEDLERLF